MKSTFYYFKGLSVVRNRLRPDRGILSIFSEDLETVT